MIFLILSLTITENTELRAHSPCSQSLQFILLTIKYCSRNKSYICVVMGGKAFQFVH